MVEKMPNGRTVGGYVMAQSQIDDLEKRKVAALERIASSLEKLSGATSLYVKQSGVEKKDSNFFDRLLGI